VDAAGSQYRRGIPGHVAGFTAVLDAAGYRDDGRLETHVGERPEYRAAMGRRAFFGRTLLPAGAMAALVALTGCPGGDQDDAGGDDE
jgi:hypothetical protein